MAFTETKNGRVVCSVCHLQYGHTPTCPIARLTEHVNDLASHMGIFLATMQETLNEIVELLRDERQEY